MSEQARAERIKVVRDVIVLQAKLVVDGLRDFALVPISLLAALVDLFDSSVPPGTHFYRVVRMGRRTERWIDLFGAAPPAEREEEGDEEYGLKDHGLDDLVEKVEGVVKEQYQRGEVPARARRKLEDLLAKLREAPAPRGSHEEDR